MDENEIATSIRKSLTLEWPDCTWQVLVGRNFGSYVSFEESRYIYFYIAQVSGGGRALLCPPYQHLLLTHAPAFSLLYPPLIIIAGGLCGL